MAEKKWTVRLEVENPNGCTWTVTQTATDGQVRMPEHDYLRVLIECCSEDVRAAVDVPRSR